LIGGKLAYHLAAPAHASILYRKGAVLPETALPHKNLIFEWQRSNGVAETSFPEGTRFFLDFNIPRESFDVLKEGTKSLRGYTGSMVRSTPYGMAIKFDKECQIESLKSL
jgi:hypothetical protein